VFYSRKATLDDAKQALAAGALDVVLKPEPSEEARKREAIAGAFSEYCQALPPDYLRR
jgi:hypothetical protein